MKNDTLIIKGAREHNLKNIDVKIPLDSFVVITGLSGSGKSSLAFDTIYAEGQRRYIESLSAYARQFLGMMQKPDLDAIHGLSPAISIEQKTVSRNPRSTVGTITEVYDYLRLLYARVGKPHCPDCGKAIFSQSAESIVDTILQFEQGTKVQVLAPIIRGKKGTYEKLFVNLERQGYSRVRVNGDFFEIGDQPELERYKKHEIDVIIDRIKVDKKVRSRVNEAVEAALKLSEGYVAVLEGTKEHLFSKHNACSDCGISFDELQPRMFSFNSPYGACETCHGLGTQQEFSEELLIPNPRLSILEGAIVPWRRRIDGYVGQMVRALAKKYKVDPNLPVKDLPRTFLNAVLYGSDKEIEYDITFKKSGSSWSYSGDFEGVVPQLERHMRETDSDSRREDMKRYMIENPCPACKGQRLKPESLSVLINGSNIHHVGTLSIRDAIEFFSDLKLSKQEAVIAQAAIKEIRNRLTFLMNVGLGYLTMNRSAGTLSGGEGQRIRLATQIGAELRGVMYILDEPSIGLHQRDNERLIHALQNLRDLGNTLIVVEHDEDTIRAADHVVDIGPGAGIHGGKVVAAGTPKQIEKNTKSLTGQYLAGKKSIALPKKRRNVEKIITIKKASEHNLKNVDVDIPLGVFTCVTGVSGSGKSTLINQTLYRALAQKINKSTLRPAAHKEIKGIEHIDKIINMDQSPIGRTPRSNPATYVKVFDVIRELFSQTQEARLRGYKPGRFSFNVDGGRCDHCRGDGVIKIEMHFLPDVFVECEKCRGKRYNRETLEVQYKGKTIADVLDMTVEEALEFFDAIPRIKKKMQTLFDVGLGYIKLGQSATTLSGGEAQRIKLTLELSKRDTGGTMYILDEPTTGLHFEDIKKLLTVLQRLVDKGNSVVVIEHNLDVIKSADYIVDLGPEGGDGGGSIVATGTPEEVAKIKQSYTGQFLRKIL